jgi:uncharacterized protein YggE
MKEFHKLIVAMAFVATPAGAQTMVTINPTADAPVMTLSATGSIDAAPDIATVNVGVETVASTAVAALQANSAKMTRVVATIRTQGVAVRDIRTNNVGVSPRYEYVERKRVFQGYAATNTVGVIIRDVATTGTFLDAVTAAGADSIDGPTFAIDRQDELRAQSRDRAVQALAANAQSYARRLGFARATLLSIQEGNVATMNMQDIIVTGSRSPMAVSAPPPPPPVLGGQQAIIVTLTGTYRLER